MRRNEMRNDKLTLIWKKGEEKNVSNGSFIESNGWLFVD